MERRKPETTVEAVEELKAALLVLLDETGGRMLRWLLHMKDLRSKSFPEER